MKFNKQKVVKVLPFLMFGYFFDKLSQAFQMSDGANIGAQIMNTVGNIGTVFQNPLPSFNPIDLLVGAAIMRISSHIWTLIFRKMLSSPKRNA